MATNKLIVTNLGALQAKYGANYPRIPAAIARLVAADAARGLTTLLVGLDDGAAMAGTGAGPVVNAGDPAQNKNAIDALYNQFAPDYIVILGAADVVPHQNLTNPVYPNDADLDITVDSDLPYACPAGYGTAVSAFINPTRVVGRLPDVTGGNDPGYLEKLLDTAANYGSRPAATYRNFLGVAAGIWLDSTALSLQAVFGTATGMNVVPPAAPPWPQPLLEAPAHFFNCHGAPSRPQYYGQPASGAEVYPVAQDAAAIAGLIECGTVMAAECCYGAELYDPTVAGQHQGMANQYLEDGAFGVWGSTTIAFGAGKAEPGQPQTTGWADVLCQYFLASVLAGASLGRAALEARQKYILNTGELTAFDLKTLAQFMLLGDPSVTPVVAPAPAAHLMMTGGTLVAASPAEAKGMERKSRRMELTQNGLALGMSVSTAEVRSQVARGPAITALLRDEVARLKLRSPGFASYAVAPARALAASKAMGFQKGMASALVSYAEAVPLRKLRAVHHIIGRIGDKNDYAMGIAGVEILEYDDGVTIRRFESR